MTNQILVLHVLLLPPLTRLYCLVVLVDFVSGQFGEIDENGIVELSPDSPAFIEAVKAFCVGIDNKNEQKKVRSTIMLFDRLSDLYMKQIKKFGYDLFDPRLKTRPFLTELKLTLRALLKRY